MTGKEAEAIKILRNATWLAMWISDDDERDKIEEAVELAVEALKLKQRILDNGYTGKEAEFRIGGRLFGIREKAQ